MPREPGIFDGVRPPVADLHLHTTASDGLLSPEQLIERVANTSLRVAAVTDHDSTAGLDRAAAAATRYPHLRLIFGIELSTGVGETEMHMVGLFIDHRSEYLQSTLERFREARKEAARKSVERLGELGVHVSWDRVQELAAGAIGRPHIARAMVEAGYVATPKEAFDKYLGDNGPVRIHRERLSPAQGIELIHRIGGAAILAHPRTVTNLDAHLESMHDAGLDAIEVFAEKYGSEDRERYIAIARRFNLVPSGGSDYHAFGVPDELLPGDPSIPGPSLEAVNELERRAKRWCDRNTASSN